ncbi:hypothetical protein [Halomonas lysinitropha]|uniref:Uncharacterized protein n=1 Tax=Halomonas lysinitropha TaxID=2607506 RepID=A0A5K1I914_9GAMM|nr:hypothetical protein [Halomonas lysinitropha]VVZ96460.1 hypothetical protein HALO32_02560 [Halomonas lysinitropha]
MNAAEQTPDLFADTTAEPPRGISEGPTFDYEAKGWREGWYCRDTIMSGWTLRPYDQDALDWIRIQLADGRLEYSEILSRRRAAKIESDLGYSADLMFSHCRYLVLTGEIIESKRYYGSPDPKSKDYHGWHPRFELAGGKA